MFDGNRIKVNQSGLAYEKGTDIFKIFPTLEFIHINFEILSEEDEEIDIDKIKEMGNPERWKACDTDIINLVKNVNELTRAVKQLNKKMEDK